MQVKQRLAFLKTLVLGQDATSSLRSRAIHSGAWIGAGFAAQKALQLGSNLILTRLLFPEAFGLMALATVFLVGLQMFSDIGLKPAIIRDPRGDDPEFLNTAWTIQAARGLLLCVIGAAIAYPISLIYGQPILFTLLAVLSTTAAINGFMSIGMATAERRLDFRTITMIQLAGQAVMIALLVTLAYFWRSVWALAVANVIGTAATVAISYILLPRHRHRLALDRESAKSLIHFGRWILFSTLATYLGGEGLKAIQGGLLSPAEFGVLAIAYTIAGIPNDLAQRLSGSVGLPILSETIRSNPTRLYAILNRFRIRMIILSIALSAGIAFAAEPLIEILYDSRYQAAGSYLSILLLSNAVTSIWSGYNTLSLAAGEGRKYFFGMLGISILRVVGLFIGFLSNGIIGMLGGVGLANTLCIFWLWFLVRKHGAITFQLDLFSMIFIALISFAILHN